MKLAVALALLLVLVVAAVLVVGLLHTRAPVVGGGASETWAELAADPVRHDKFRLLRDQITPNIPKLDWDRVRSQLKANLRDDHEWIGIIDVKDGVPRVTAKQRGGRSHITPELFKKYSERRGMFLFHTHTPDVCGLPTAADISSSIDSTRSTRFAAHLVISENGMYAYGATDRLTRQIWSDPTPRLSVLTRMYDAYTMLEGRRSWEPWTLLDLRTALRRHGIAFHAIRSEGLGKKCFSSTSPVNHDYLAKMHTWIREEEGRVRQKI